MPKIKFEKICEYATMPVVSTTQSAGIDLFYCHRSGPYHWVNIAGCGVVQVDTGIKLDMSDFPPPKEGYTHYLDLRLRSSLRGKGLTSMGSGTIDLDYPGEIVVLIYDLTNLFERLNHSDKIAQLILTRHDRQLCDVEVLDEVRTGGFGSTGQ